MAVIHPFSALRPPAARAKQVSSVPYDVVNTEEARKLAANNPLSFLHVSRPEIDLPEGTDIYSESVYRKAVENFQNLIKTCPLETEEVPSIYLYRLIMGDHEQIGVVACCSIDEYDRDVIRKHERTRRDKEDDRTRHMLALRAQTGPVFLTYRARRNIDTMVMETTMANAIFDFTVDDGIQHTIWRVPDPVRFVQAFRQVPNLYIADGHHRAASASRVSLAGQDPNAAKTDGTVASLDVTILQERLLAPVLGIADVRTDKRIDFVGGLRGSEELERLVHEGKAAVAFALYPTTVQDLLRVADAGEIMPPKSTWFEPKLRDGLLIHTI